MKIRSVKLNNQRKAFELTTRAGLKLAFPYANALPQPTAGDPIGSAYVDVEIASEGFTYILASGEEGTVLIDQVLEYNQDPDYLRNMLLYEITLEAIERMDASRHSAREVCRRLKTSPSQLYRLLDPTNYRKSLDKMVALLQALDCNVKLVVDPALR